MKMQTVYFTVLLTRQITLQMYFVAFISVQFLPVALHKLCSQTQRGLCPSLQTHWSGGEMEQRMKPRTATIMQVGRASSGPGL